jgi:hypothetical protein
MLGRRLLHPPSHHLLHQKLGALAQSSPFSSSDASFSSSDAQSRLLEQWRDFDATKLSPEQMEVGCWCNEYNYGHMQLRTCF